MSGHRYIIRQNSVIIIFSLKPTQYLRADLLVDGLLKLLVVEDGPHLAVAVARPEGCGHLGLGLAHVSSVVTQNIF